MFDRRMPAVVSMNHEYLARYDGSEMASGRGSGLEKNPRDEVEDEGGRNGQSNRVDKTPYMHMTFHPLER